MDSTFFHETQLDLQHALGTAGIAARIADTRLRESLEGDDAELVRAAAVFFLATRAPDGTLDVSVKCGRPGFVEIPQLRQLVFPDYDGNGMFRSLGNIRATADVALLFVEFSGRQRKLRLQGRAEVEVCVPQGDRRASGGPQTGPQARVHVSISRVFPNCPRYLPTLAWAQPSAYVDALGREPLEPEWKRKPDLAPWVAERRVY